jgi:putative tricarboxylic transport membrane protein
MTDTLSNVADGFGILLQPELLLPMLFGVLVGTAVGVLPGIGPIGAIAVLLPLSFTLDPTAALLMLAGIFFGVMYGGSTTSILMRVPGEATSVITAIDGFEMTKRGRAGAALAVAALGSFIAGTLAIVALMFAAPALSDIAIRFAAPEFLAITVFALLVLSRLSSVSFAKPMMAAGLGLALATIGLDQVTGDQRFTFGYFELAQGVDLTAVAVGLFGVAEVLLLAEQRGSPQKLPTVRFRELYPTRAELRRAVPSMFRGGLLGFFVGLIPGPSGVMSTYASYALERRLSQHKEEFGKGAIEGVAGPEAANNGATGGGMIPLLLLGIPFSPIAAMLLAGFTIHGITPGPLLIQQHPDLFWGLIAGFYVANFMLLLLNLPLVTIFTTLLRIPRDVMLAGILVLAVVGTFAARNTMFDVAVLIIMGLVGYVMVKVGLSRATLLLAFVIAAFMERSLVQTMVLARGNFFPFIVQRPLAVALLAVTLAIVLAPPLIRLLRPPHSYPRSAVHDAQ